MLTDTLFEVLSPNNYTCNINKVNKINFPRNSKEYSTDRLYLIENLLDNSINWGTLNFGPGYITCYFKLFGKINIKHDGTCELLYNPKFIIINGDNINVYDIYVPSVKIYSIPYKYKIIPNDKRKWNEMCKIVKKNEPISVIINVVELKRFIETFL